jgi:hypothetical protein
MPAAVGDWSYIGCYLDNINGVRTFPDAFTADDEMTLESCAAFCSQGSYNGKPYNFFGTEYYREVRLHFLERTHICEWDGHRDTMLTEHSLISVLLWLYL